MEQKLKRCGTNEFSISDSDHNPPHRCCKFFCVLSALQWPHSRKHFKQTIQSLSPLMSYITEVARNPHDLQTHKIAFGSQLWNKNRTKSQRSYIVPASFNQETNIGCSLCPVFDRSLFPPKVKWLLDLIFCIKQASTFTIALCSTTFI